MTAAPAAQALAQLEAASARLRERKPGEARALLEKVLRVAPRSSDALHLYSVSLRLLGDAEGAEPPVRQAIAIDKRQPAYHGTLGDILADLGWKDKAEKSYRTALGLNRFYMPAARQLTLLLTNLGRPEEALQVISPLVANPKVIDHQGWIKFGEPGIPIQPKLGRQWFVNPQPGVLVLFPSYLWHGTVPFEGSGSRLTIAFDVVPEKR